MFFLYISELSLCQKKRKEAEKLPPLGRFVPQCKSDGSFKEKQCHSSTGQCWCVDQNGHEWSGTRTRGDLDCTTSGISRRYWQKFANFSHKHEKCIFWLKISLKCKPSAQFERPKTNRESFHFKNFFFNQQTFFNVGIHFNASCFSACVINCKCDIFVVIYCLSH